MKKLLFSIIFLTALLVPVLALAEPFLKAGATLNTTKWQLDLDGVIIDLPVDSIDATTAWMKYDLAGITSGDHLVRVRAGNVWVWSNWYPLAFTKALVDVFVEPFIE